MSSARKPAKRARIAVPSPAPSYTSSRASLRMLSPCLPNCFKLSISGPCSAAHPARVRWNAFDDEEVEQEENEQTDPIVLAIAHSKLRIAAAYYDAVQDKLFLFEDSEFASHYSAGMQS